MDDLRGLLDRVPNARIRVLCGVAKRVDESVLRWFGHIERMENDRIFKRECGCSLGRVCGHSLSSKSTAEEVD